MSIYIKMLCWSLRNGSGEFQLLSSQNSRIENFLFFLWKANKTVAFFSVISTFPSYFPLLLFTLSHRPWSWTRERGTPTANVNSYDNNSCLMTCLCFPPSMSCGPEQSLKGFAKWSNHFWRWRSTGTCFSKKKKKTGWTSRAEESFLLAHILAPPTDWHLLSGPGEAYWQGHGFPD